MLGLYGLMEQCLSSALYCAGSFLMLPCCATSTNAGIQALMPATRRAGRGGGLTLCT